VKTKIDLILIKKEIFLHEIVHDAVRLSKKLIAESLRCNISDGYIAQNANKLTKFHASGEASH